jgi:small subunit ribosomal protein S24e
MSDSVTVRTRKFIKNSLLQRRQMIIDVVHPNKANASRAELKEALGKMYKSDAELVIVFGMKTQFGGGKSSGFALIYDNKEALVKFEPKHRVVRNGMGEKKETSRKQIKESKNRGKKIRGTGASIAKHKAKRAEAAE